jgi:hypothetical protein
MKNLLFVSVLLCGCGIPLGTDEQPLAISDMGPPCDGISSRCSGVCVNEYDDADNCGSCGYVCEGYFASGSICMDGRCTCGAGTTLCGRVCSTLNGDWQNCGACGRVCSSAQRCQGGTCVACPSGEVACGGVCTSLATDAANCGACGSSCLSNQLCRAGKCVNRPCSCVRPNLCCPDLQGGTYCARTCY